jgi:glucan-binding YG repeat protein
VDCEYYVPGNDLGIAAGTYAFDENGFLVEPISSEKNGVYFENGAWYYYENGKIGYNKGLTAHGDGYIYVRSSGKLATGAYYITNVPEELSSLFRVGQKVIFNENGIADAPKHGIVDGYYYQYGAVRYNAGLIQVDGKWIYVRSNGALATGRYWVTNTNGATEAGYYEFDKNGYMIISEIEDGIVVEGEDLYYYLDGKKQFGLGLVRLEDGSYIYVRTGGELAVGSYWITNHNGLLIEGMYEFSQDGILTIN